MTREEAIKWVTFDFESWEHQCLSYHPIKEALKMAIEALKQPEIIKCKDCKFATKYGNLNWCDKLICDGVDDWFCASARRKEK